MVAGLWTALYHPWYFIAFLFLFILLLIWILPKMWRSIKKIFALIGRFFGFSKTSGIEEEKSAHATTGAPDAAERS